MTDVCTFIEPLPLTRVWSVGDRAWMFGRPVTVVAVTPCRDRVAITIGEDQ